MIPVAERRKIVWTRKSKTPKRSASEFTSAERQNIVQAARFLVRRYGNQTKLATAMRVSYSTLSHVFMKRRAISPTTAFKIARLAKTALDDVLAGKRPPKGACPYCGHAPDVSAR